MAVLALDYCRSCWPLPVSGSDNCHYRMQWGIFVIGFGGPTWCAASSSKLLVTTADGPGLGRVETAARSDREGSALSRRKQGFESPRERQ